MNILGVNPFHNGSICILSNGELVYFLEEERLSRLKQDELPFKTLLKVLSKYKIDYIAIGGLNHKDVISGYRGENIIFSFIKKFIDPTPPCIYLSHHHHLTHISSAFFNSGFEESLGIVIDGGGSFYDDKFQEKVTIFECKYPLIFKTIFKESDNIFSDKTKEGLSLGECFEKVCNKLGFGGLEGGKIMGLAPYGAPNPLFFNLFNKTRTNPKLLSHDDNSNLKNIFPKGYNPKKWHFNSNLDINLEKDLAYEVQYKSQQILGNYIEEYLNKTGFKKVCIAGGYGLNCVANYYLLKRFPNIEFYFEPLSSDAGTAIGAAKLLWHESTQDKTIRPQKTLYYGPQYSKEQLLEGIQKYVSN
jgi:carbamoyltransferase